jgi:hypothetical protein
MNNSSNLNGQPFVSKQQEDVMTPAPASPLPSLSPPSSMPPSSQIPGLDLLSIKCKKAFDKQAEKEKARYTERWHFYSQSIAEWRYNIKSTWMCFDFLLSMETFFTLLILPSLLLFDAEPLGFSIHWRHDHSQSNPRLLRFPPPSSHRKHQLSIPYR